MLYLRDGLFLSDPLRSQVRVALEEAFEMPCGGVLNLNGATPWEEVKALGDKLAQFAAIEITFDHFADGRGFTLARNLREKGGFTGDLRATGGLIPDQTSYLWEVGFSSALLDSAMAKRHGLEAWKAARDKVELKYQPHTEGERRFPKGLSPAAPAPG